MAESKIYVIVNYATTSGGHGEPGSKIVRLAHDMEDVWHCAGKLLPAYRSFDEAEKKRKEFDKYNFFQTKEISLV